VPDHRERLRRLLEQLPAAVAVLDGPDHVYSLSNRENDRLLGRRVRIGATARETIDHPQLQALLEGVYRSGVGFQAREFPVQLKDEDGTVRDLFVSGVYEPLRDERGEVDGVLSFSYDVTDHVLARRRAEASEARLRRLHDSGVIGVVYWTQEGRLVDANDAFLAMVGYSREDIESGRLDWREMTPREFAWRDARAFVEMQQHGICTPYEKEYLHRDGTRIPIQLGVALWEGSTNDGVAWILDIRTRKAAEEAERKARAEAEAAVQRRDEFLSIASHELKTPLTSLALQVESLLRAIERGDKGQLLHRGGRVRAQLGRLSQLVDELLDATRISSGRLPMTAADMDLVELVDEVLARFDVQASVAGSSITRDGVSSARGRWDRGRLDQVLTNLVSNALKYGERSPVHVHIAEAEWSVVLTVADQGPGIAKEHHARIFERFERVSGDDAGLGLGLWIVRSIIVAHRGTIALESEVGRGATFRVTLPRDV